MVRHDRHSHGRVFLTTIDGSIVNLALPTLVRYFDTSFAVVQWVVLAYLLTISTLMLSFGRLADMIGKKAIYTSGFIIFTIGSVLCGFSPTIYWLIAFRVVQAVGGAMILALSMAIITESFPPEERGRALGHQRGNRVSGHRRRTYARRLAGRCVFLALDLLRQSACGHCRHVAGVALHSQF